MANQSVGKKEKSRAIIIERGHILLIKRTKPGDIYWVFPGGGVEAGETPEQAVVRECFEELGLHVAVDDLYFQEQSTDPRTPDVVEFFYLCHITGGTLGDASGPEYQFGTHYVGTYELVWVKISDLPQTELRPNSIRDKVVDRLSS